MATRKEITQFMRFWKFQYIKDDEEFPCTIAAETAADYFNEYEDEEFTIDDKYFEVAFEVSEE